VTELEGMKRVAEYSRTLYELRDNLMSAIETNERLTQERDAALATGREAGLREASDVVTALREMVALWERVHSPDVMLGRPTVNAAKKALAATPSPPAEPRTIHNPNPVYNLGVSRFDTWQVQVMANGEPVLTIGSNFLSGRDDIDSFADLVQSCGEHLLSFMGAAIPSPPKGCEDKEWDHRCEEFDAHLKAEEEKP
jgi:hypothetical protein